MSDVAQGRCGAPRVEGLRRGGARGSEWKFAKLALKRDKATRAVTRVDFPTVSTNHVTRG